MDSKLSYEYIALTESDAIRLIVLQPSEYLNAQVRCNLIHTTLAECNSDLIDQYSAISYVWGNAASTVPVSVDGKYFAITRSLDAALRHVRDRSRPLRLWADGLCINQLNAEERNQQVRQMASVYAVAQHTIIYLGESSPEAESDLENLRRCVAQFDKSYKEPSKTDNGDLPDSILELTGRLVQRSWFKRIWVFQELVFSKDPWIQCGTTRFRWDNFFDVIETRSEDLGTEHAMFRQMAQARSDRQKSFSLRIDPIGYSYGLLQVLQSRRGLGVADPRDMLFAHAGIIASLSRGTTEIPSLLKVDYGKSCEDVYQGITQFLIEDSSAHKAFNVLASVEDVEMDARQPDLASWATDWTVPKQTTPMDLNLLAQSRTGFFDPTLNDNTFQSAIGSYDTFASSHAWISSPAILAFVGHHSGIVQDLSPVISWSVASFDLSQELIKRSSQIRRKQLEETNGIDEVWEYTKRACTEVMKKWRYKLRDIIFPVGMAEDISCHRPKDPSEIPSYLAAIYQSIDHYCTPISSYNMLPRPPIYADLLTQFILRSIMSRDEPSIFHGRRFARLQNGSLALVPASTHEGDIICTYEWSSASFLLRRTESQEPGLNEKIKQAFSCEGAEEMEVEQFKFVGQCLADDVMKSTGPWKKVVHVPEKVSRKSAKPLIFAMF